MKSTDKPYKDATVLEGEFEAWLLAGYPQRLIAGSQARCLKTLKYSAEPEGATVINASARHRERWVPARSAVSDAEEADPVSETGGGGSAGCSGLRKSATRPVLPRYSSQWR